MSANDYEVFKGVPQENPMRLGTVQGHQRATDLMYRMYARSPGDYFVRDVQKVIIVSLVRGAAASPREPNFDIFRGLPDKNAVWVEAVEGLSAARDRMEQIARDKPGNYFVFSRMDHSILGLRRSAEKAEGTNVVEFPKRSGTAA